MAGKVKPENASSVTPKRSRPKAASATAGIPIVRLVHDGVARLDLPPINCKHHASALAAHLLENRDRETFVAIHLDSKLRVLSAEVVAIGTLSATLVHPREVFKGALLSNAASIVVAHNHPSGDPTPSPEDLALTQTLIRAGELLGVAVHDHLIIGETTLSLRETTRLWDGSTVGAT
jgi:DNA repair protein RadC